MSNEFALQQSLASAALTWGNWEVVGCESAGVLVWDVAFEMLCESLSNYCFSIIFAFRKELLASRILSMKCRSKQEGDKENILPTCGPNPIFNSFANSVIFRM